MDTFKCFAFLLSEVVHWVLSGTFPVTLLVALKAALPGLDSSFLALSLLTIVLTWYQSYLYGYMFCVDSQASITALCLKFQISASTLPILVDLHTLEALQPPPSSFSCLASNCSYLIYATIHCRKCESSQFRPHMPIRILHLTNSIFTVMSAFWSLCLTWLIFGLIVLASSISLNYCVRLKVHSFFFIAFLVHKYNTYASCTTHASVSAFTAGTAYTLLQRWFKTLLPALHVLAVLKHLWYFAALWIARSLHFP